MLESDSCVSLYFDYIRDAFEHSVLLLDILRQRGNAYFEQSSRTAPHVLTNRFSLVQLSGIGRVAGGLYVIVFTGGIGEQDAVTPAEATTGRARLGLTFDGTANRQAATLSNLHTHAL